ncbi:MAG: ligand-binding sensor domain-containing protein/DNA-binding CsgD family transcriptional regulator [Cyclobacteriaceae bacterium]|jgi:ligand-binding sensor domain-containing protein/DNA-binding CsgD family transcriptional regulator
MQRKLAIALFITFIHFNVVSQVSRFGLPITQNFSPKKYGAGIQNWDIAQDNQGIMYFSNNLGLLEYDGINWNLHSVKNATKVRSVLIGNDGKIYVGCQGDFGYFVRNEQGGLSYTSLADSLSIEDRNFDETWNVYKNEETIYFCTFDNIYVYNKNDIEVIKPQNSLEMSFLINRKLHSQEWNVGLTILENDRLVKVANSEFFDAYKIASIIPIGPRQLWVATQSGEIFIYDGTVFSKWTTGAHDILVSALINTAIRLKNGNIAIGTQNNGLLILSAEGTLLRHLNKERGLLSRTVLSLYQDLHQNLWAGLNNGISYVELSSPFNIINEQIVPGTGYTALLDDSRLYLGTNNGAFYYDSRKPNEPFQMLPNTAGQVYNISKINNEILIGHNKGTLAFVNGATTQKSDKGSWTFLRPRKNQEVLLEGNYFGLSLYKWNKNWQHQYQLNGLNESARVMEEDDNSHIWMTHGYKGVYRIELTDKLDSIENVRYYNSKDGFPSNLLINVFRIRNRLVFTSQNGIYKYDAKSDAFIPDQLFNEIFGPDNEIRMLKEDMLGNIYFISQTNTGVVKFNNLGEYVVETNLFNKTKGLLNDDLPNITVLDHKNIIMGAKEGFIHYNPLIKKDFDQAFHSIIRKVEIYTKNEERTSGENYIIKSLVGNQLFEYEQNSVRFSYAASFYEDPDYLEFQYMLEGFDESWSDWSKSSIKEYTNLREKKYVFMVRARNIYGTMSNVSNYGFEVAPPWYRTSWGYLGYFLIAFVVLFSSLNFQSRRHKKDKKMMSLKQERELNAKNTRINDITRVTDEEITRLKNEKLKAEVDHKNKELATSAMLLINKNEFISEIKNGLNAVTKKSSLSERTKELSKIIKNIEKNKKKDHNWEHFEFHFDRVHGDFSERLKTKYSNLSPQERRMGAYLRMNLSSKEIANLLNISVRGVEISRYRLRKKLGIEREVNLAEFILNF